MQNNLVKQKQNQNPTCIYCNSLKTKKIGKRKNKQQEVQRLQCKGCNKTFTASQIKYKTYPSKVILNSISYYNLGHTQKEVSKLIVKKYKTAVPQKTISNWLKEYKHICTFSRLRKQAINLYKPEDLIFQQILNHIQPYTFKYHKAKLDILLKETPKFSAIKSYIEKINSKEFPHHIFTYNKDGIANNQRASQLKFNHNQIKIISKTNQSTEMAKLALNLAKNNNERHQKLQDFFLINDSTTIAAEIPIYLTNWDAGYYRRLEIKDFQRHARWNQKGFIFPLTSYKTPITGHIDILQIRNGLIHILDYKPDANKINPTEQLTLYALALSRKLNLPLYPFKCAWFDENNYFEFFPLHAVYENRKV